MGVYLKNTDNAFQVLKLHFNKLVSNSCSVIAMAENVSGGKSHGR